MANDASVWLHDGCTTDQLTDASLRQCVQRSAARKAAVQCCGIALGSSCLSVCDLGGSAMLGRSVTFDQAHTFCLSKNMRLCTRYELSANYCCGNRCAGVRNMLTWTADPCGGVHGELSPAPPPPSPQPRLPFFAPPPCPPALELPSGQAPAAKSSSDAPDVSIWVSPANGMELHPGIHAVILVSVNLCLALLAVALIRKLVLQLRERCPLEMPIIATLRSCHARLQRSRAARGPKRHMRLHSEQAAKADAISHEQWTPAKEEIEDEVETPATSPGKPLTHGNMD